MKKFVFLIFVITLVGCGGSSEGLEVITRDSTYKNPNSDYIGTVTTKTWLKRDSTILKMASGPNVVEYEETEICGYQRVRLKAKNKLHLGETAHSVRALDRSCSDPHSVTWDNIVIRSSLGSGSKNVSPRVKDDIAYWLKDYLRQMYLNFPELENVQER